MRKNFDSILDSSAKLAQSWGVQPVFQSKRSRKVPKFIDELSSDQRLTDSKKYFETQIFYAALDIIIIQIKTRFNGLNEISTLFSPIMPQNIFSWTEEQIQIATTNLVEKYEKDLSLDLTNEILQLKTTFGNKLCEIKSVYNLAKFLIVENHLLASNFSNTCTACILFLTIPVTVATAERSFSKLKLIKSYLRSTISEQRLSGLAMISIEKSRAINLNTSTIITALANTKARRYL